jgi:hypothetical protein
MGMSLHCMSMPHCRVTGCVAPCGMMNLPAALPLQHGVPARCSTSPLAEWEALQGYAHRVPSRHHLEIGRAEWLSLLSGDVKAQLHSLLLWGCVGTVQRRAMRYQTTPRGDGRAYALFGAPALVVSRRVARSDEGACLPAWPAHIPREHRRCMGRRGAVRATTDSQVLGHVRLWASAASVTWSVGTWLEVKNDLGECGVIVRRLCQAVSVGLRGATDYCLPCRRPHAALHCCCFPG